MADRLITYLAHHRSKSGTMSEAKPQPNLLQKRNASDIASIEQPKFVPNPLLRRIRRRRAQLNLSKSIDAPGPTSVDVKKPLSAMSVREKLRNGIGMDFARLMRSPSAFDRVFPLKLAAAGPTQDKPTPRKHVSTKRHLEQKALGEAINFDDEEKEAGRYQNSMRSV